MFCISTRIAVAGGLVIAASCTKHYRAEGVVLGVDPASRTLQISHRAIPGYMEGMAMSFQAAGTQDLAEFSAGSRVGFKLNVNRKGSYISDIRKRKPGADDIPIPPAPHRVAIGDPVPDFSLTDQHGQPFRLSSLRGRHAAIDFIYTRCPLPDVCPRLSAHFALLQKRFGPRLALLSVTIDPQHDTPAVLADYARRWQAGPDWHFLTGGQEQVQQAAAPFGLIYWPEDGLITHTSATALIGPDGKLEALLEGSTYTSRQLLDLVGAKLAASAGR